ncbi:molybdopterin-dependent oxidoreductase [Thermogymnomonas acidicola]|uniref:molybdopterin cofactor-binding domain-containing protein n=1 Tax=Thermogymnomonas acidicola TaxID=399579 RepID=UPI001494B04D|nr:molybdopterin cofactor-binding domain-containing protein [Thermogymnomonas acidicola]
MPGESAKISVRDSKVHVWLGGNQHGQRHDDIIVNILREELGLSSEEIVVHKGDTDELGEGVGTWGAAGPP